MPQPPQPPYPALLPFQVFDYPIAHLMREKGPVAAEAWPPRADPEVAAWRDATSHLPEGGNLIYVHVPFCPFFCHFCFLYKSKEASDRGPERREEFVQALLRHIAMLARRHRYDGAPFTTIYFGGGTPTELTPSQLTRILTALGSAFPIAGDAEVTLESVSSHLLDDRLDACLEAGFNRVSFGVQTLDPAVRRRIGRGESIESYERLAQRLRARNVPFNVDLMIGLPGQTVDSFAADVRRVSAWGTGSVDIYTYWMVPGSRMYDGVLSQHIDDPADSDRRLAFRVAAKRLMKEMGFRPVATEAYVRTDTNKFMQSTFGGGGNAQATSLAFGPSAFGFINGTLHRDVPDLHEYLRLIDRGYFPFQCRQTLDLPTARRRAVLMGIQRLTVPRVIMDAHAPWRRLADRWVEHGLVVARPESYDLTDWGATWFNLMQLEVVPMRERLGMAGMMGAPSQQLARLAGAATGGDVMMREFTRTVSGRPGLEGRLRLAAYKNYLRLRRLVDDRACNFAGAVDGPGTKPERPA